MRIAAPKTHGGGRTRGGAAGFTLVEVMAAMTIFAIAMVAVYSTVEFQQHSYSTQSRVAVMQQNLRSGVEYLAHDIRMASYLLSTNINFHDNEIASSQLSRYILPVNSTTDPDSITLLYAYDNDSFHPDVQNFTITAGATTITFASAPAVPYAVGDRLLVRDGTNADLLLVTAVPSSTQLTLYQGPTNSYPDPNITTLHRVRYVRFFIDSSDPSRPVLMEDRRNGQAPQPVADDIEDMQFQYGLATSVADNTVVDVADNNVVGDRSQIRQVRILMLARSRLPERGWSETRPGLADRAGGASADGYRRRDVSVVVDVRNSGI
jgi:prepilin-type N-terminal cleavage/methylation domain-containing protein